MTQVSKASQVSLQILVWHVVIDVVDVISILASIGRLPDKDLSKFLTDTPFKGGFCVFASVIFVLYRSMKCMIENDPITYNTNTLCATCTSLYLIIYWFLKLVHGLIKEEWRKDISLSLEKTQRSS